MRPREAVKDRGDTSGRRWTISTRLTLMVTPIVVMTLLFVGTLTWGTVSGQAGPLGVTILLAVLGLVVATGTVITARRVGKTLSSRVAEVSTAARRVANRDLVELLDALRNPESEKDAIPPMTLDTGRGDEVGDLARSFQELHSSLIEVGARQMETLRVGVSSIFSTLARRNSSLVDRQLALLDQLEEREEDPEVLGGFYQLDHLATRMRRNAESLLVLAGSESPRVWAKATEMSDVVRAAVSEIDEYQRIDVLALEPARLSGGAVSDVSHLIAELLENAIQFSPPSETIRVTGLFDMDGYQLAVSDRGVGMSEARITEMNRILKRPPALGLSVEPTLGMYVVAKLAHRHGLKVELIRGVPGVTARITIPRDHLETGQKPQPRPFSPDHTARVAAERGTPTEFLEYGDVETREYLLKMSREREIVTPVTSGIPIDEQLIDLTRPPYDEPDPDLPSSGLPVRTPGLSFNDDDDVLSPVSAEGSSRIQSALAAYDRGRRSAAGSDDETAARGAEEDPEEQT